MRAPVPARTTSLRPISLAVVLSARLMVRYADKYDPDLASAFEKLEQGLPPALAEHVERTLDVLSKAPRDEGFSANVRLLTKAWAERRVVTIDYEPAHYDAGASPRTATVRPYLLEPSLQTHALYLIGYDEGRKAIRTFKVERIRAAVLTPRTFESPSGEITSFGPPAGMPMRSRESPPSMWPAPQRTTRTRPAPSRAAEARSTRGRAAPRARSGGGASR